ncbi:hypothetical protein GTS_57400 [Gandjariella thermophila]|uniref:Uncharacterized protein n=1 Tax=Gandjariella thermophila TaxID=1931992 RepID=A0A4D4JJK5_9PSEU|nr:hypothetical protein GTS_57400 [Gandjariella thermophila]
MTPPTVFPQLINQGVREEQSVRDDRDPPAVQLACLAENCDDILAHEGLAAGERHAEHALAVQFVDDL